MQDLLRNHELIRQLLRHSFDRLYLVDLESHRCTEHLPQDLTPVLVQDYGDWILSLARNMHKADSTTFFAQMDLNRISEKLAGGDGRYPVYFRLLEPGEEYELTIFYGDRGKTTLVAVCRRFSGGGVLTCFDELSRTEDRFRFLVDHVVEDFVEVRVSTGECRIYRQGYGVKCFSSFPETLAQWGKAVVVPEEREAFFREFELNHMLETLRTQPGCHHFTCTADLGGLERTLSIVSTLHQERFGRQEDYIFAFAQDVTKLREQEMRNKQLVDISQQLLTLSQADPVTELYNRAAGEKFIEECLSASSDAGTMLLMDIDRFKDFNDHYGHQVGDFVLKFLSKCMQDVFRSDDILCRWGGDEFVVFMRDVSRKTVVESRIQRLRSRMQHCRQGNLALTVTVSIGCAVAKEGITLRDLFAQCDKALYQVKESGRNSYFIDDK